MKTNDLRNHDNCYHFIVQDLELTLSLGIYLNERQKAQRIRVSVDCCVPAAVLGYVRHMQDTINYEKLYRYLKSWQERQHTELIEYLLQDMSDFCFKDPRIVQVKTEIFKIDIFPDKSIPGISLSLTRQEWQQIMQKI